MQIEFCLLVISLHMSENWGLDIAYKNCSNFGDFFSHDTFLVNIELNKIELFNFGRSFILYQTEVADPSNKGFRNVQHHRTLLLISTINILL